MYNKYRMLGRREMIGCHYLSPGSTLVICHDKQQKKCVGRGKNEHEHLFDRFLVTQFEQTE